MHTSFGHAKYDIKSRVVNAYVHLVKIVLLSGVDTESDKYHSHITVERLETQNKQFFQNTFFFFFLLTL